MRSIYRLSLLILLFSLWGSARHLFAQTTPSSFLQPTTVLQDNPPLYSISHPLLPAYIRRNPMGYAPLCRLEVKIEQRLPVGVWIRADGSYRGPGLNPGLAYLRFRMPIAGSRTLR